MPGTPRSESIFFDHRRLQVPLRFEYDPTERGRAMCPALDAPTDDASHHALLEQIGQARAMRQRSDFDPLADDCYLQAGCIAGEQVNHLAK
jgi:hypothetical protein